MHIYRISQGVTELMISLCLYLCYAMANFHKITIVPDIYSEAKALINIWKYYRVYNRQKNCKNVMIHYMGTGEHIEHIIH